MGFYESIAPYYHHIFPLNPDQVDFTNTVFDHSGKASLLEVGCGIGSLSFALAKIYRKVVGIDLDKSMLITAEESKAMIPQGENHPIFYHSNMLSILDTFGNSSFDGVLCFGNTLVHLDSTVQVLDFFSQSKAVLRPGGKLLFQILNYDKIIKQHISSLPITENEFIRFERSYAFPNHSDKIEFNTTLTIKNTEQVIHNKISLLPLTKSVLQEILSKAKFTQNSLYGSYHSDPFTSESEILVVKAES